MLPVLINGVLQVNPHHHSVPGVQDDSGQPERSYGKTGHSLELTDDLSIVTHTELSQCQKIKIFGNKADASICQ